MRGILRVAVVAVSMATASAQNESGPPPAFDVASIGAMPPPPPDAPRKPDLFAAMQQQLGLRLTASRGLVDVIVIDRVEQP